MNFLPKDLGLDLEEDSPDLSEAEACGAENTSSIEVFIKRATEKIVEIPGEAPRFELRRKAGFLYCRLFLGDSKHLFKLEWLR